MGLLSDLVTIHVGANDGVRLAHWRPLRRSRRKQIRLEARGRKNRRGWK